MAAATPTGCGASPSRPPARLYAAVDRYHWLIAGEPRSARLSSTEALAQLRREAGGALAPDAVAAIAQALQEEAAA